MSSRKVPTKRPASLRLRFAVAAALVFAATSCSLLDSSPTTTVRDPADDPVTTIETTAAAEPVTEESGPRDVALVADVVRRMGGALVRSGETLAIEGVAGGALLAFELPASNGCVDSATLTLTSPSPIAGLVRVQAWVSLETEVADLPEGANLGTVVVAKESPGVDGAIEGDTITWDVLELIEWAKVHQRDAEAFVVAVLPTFATDVDAVEFHASEGGRPASLTVVDAPLC